MTESASLAISSIKSVYIVEPKDHGWIIERLMRDISAELACRGIRSRIGSKTDYDGEDVIFNSRYLTPLSDARAQVNSLFITHLDDKVKELEFRSQAGMFNSLVCMSRQEADFIAGLVGHRQGVVGIDMPARDLTVTPLRLGLFSARYEDGRKNEQWIIDYFETKCREHKDNFVICLMGWGWEPFCAKLGRLEMNYEIYRYSRFTPGEYGIYKTVLQTMDFLLYLGFDGGAMCVYDALAAGVDVIATDISYHRGLGPSVSLVADVDGFFDQMDRLHARNISRKVALSTRSIQEYVSHLIAHWNEVAIGRQSAPVSARPAPTSNSAGMATEAAAAAAAVKLFRGHYKPIGFSRVRSFLIRLIQRYQAR